MHLQRLWQHPRARQTQQLERRKQRAKLWRTANARQQVLQREWQWELHADDVEARDSTGVAVQLCGALNVFRNKECLLCCALVLPEVSTAGRNTRSHERRHKLTGNTNISNEKRSQVVMRISSSLMGDSTNAATLDVSQAKKNYRSSQIAGMRPKHLRLAGIRTVLCHQDSVRVPPIALAAARHTPPVALFFPMLH